MTWLKGRDLSIRCSVSPYLCELLSKERGEEQAAAILAAGLVPRALSIRPDPRLAADKERYDRWLDALRGAVGSVRSHPLLPRLLLVDDPGDIRKLPGFTEGAFAVQDAASALAVDAAGIGRDDLVLDVCAAPGGKAIYAASLLKDPSRMTARDLTEEKCALIKENAERMRLSGMRIRQQDASHFSGTVAMPLPLSVEPCTLAFAGETYALTRVEFAGMTHLIAAPRIAQFVVISGR
jgi:16S rRNA (cytosine967-C5)-methyltransferase